MAGPVRSAVVALVVLAVVVAGGWAAASFVPTARPALSSALATLPQDTRIISLTDWAQVRSGPVPTDELGRRDVATRSVLYSSAGAMDEQLGWSVADLDWEALGQTSSGEYLVARMSGSLSTADVEDGLEAAGFERDGPLWTRGGADLARIGLSDLMQQVRVLGRERLVVMGTQPEPVGDVVRVVRSGEPAVTRDRALVDVARALAGNDAMLLQRGALGCETTALTDPDDTDAADVALERAGALQTYSASGRAIVDRGGDAADAQDVTFAMAFDGPTAARDQAQVREALSTGPFIGRRGDVADTLDLVEARADAHVTTLRFHHDPASEVVMTGIGPLLFATC